MEKFGKLNDAERKLWQEFQEVKNLFNIQSNRMQKLDAEFDCKHSLFWSTVSNRLKIWDKNLKLNDETWEVEEMTPEEASEGEDDNEGDDND
jgi:hypothetical protein